MKRLNGLRIWNYISSRRHRVPHTISSMDNMIISCNNIFYLLISETVVLTAALGQCPRLHFRNSSSRSSVRSLFFLVRPFCKPSISLWSDPVLLRICRSIGSSRSACLWKIAVSLSEAVNPESVLLVQRPPAVSNRDLGKRPWKWRSTLR